MIWTFINCSLRILWLALRVKTTIIIFDRLCSWNFMTFLRVAFVLVWIIALIRLTFLIARTYFIINATRFLGHFIKEITLLIWVIRRLAFFLFWDRFFCIFLSEFVQYCFVWVLFFFFHNTLLNRFVFLFWFTVRNRTLVGILIWYFVLRMFV